MVGRVIDVGGNPVQGLKVESLEAQDFTDETGRFAVQYKPPEQFVSFLYQEQWYKRVLRPEDSGKELVLQLPLLRDLRVECELTKSCNVGLSWQVAAGFSVSTAVACEPAGKLLLRGVPRDPPQVSCPGLEGVRGEIRGDSLVILPARKQVRIEVVSDGAEPSACTVQVGDRMGSPLGGGVYVAEVSGVVTASAICEGRPALPRTLDTSLLETVSLSWSSQGPYLDLAPIAPTADRMWLVSETEVPTWMIEIPPSADGTYALPILPPGVYRLGAVDAGAMALASVPTSLEAGVVRYRTEGGVVGFLKVDTDLSEGVIPLAPALDP